MPALTHILFDFFGTLVTYSASRTEQGCLPQRDARRASSAKAVLC